MQGRGMNIWAVLVLCAIVLGIGLFIGANIRPGGAQTAGTNSAIPRDQFRAALIGKTQEEVLSMVGRPNATSDSSGRVLWRYDGVTYDPVTGQIGEASVFFQNGRVDNFIFH